MVLSEFEIDAWYYSYYSELYMFTPAHSKIERETQRRYSDRWSRAASHWYGPDNDLDDFIGVASGFDAETHRRATEFLVRFRDESLAIEQLDAGLLKVRLTNGR